MRGLQILIRLLPMVFLTSCFRYEGVAESWEGRTADELVTVWGPPSASWLFHDGRRSLSYRHQHAVSGFNPYAPYQTGIYECNASFEVDSHGVITSAKVAGNLGGCNTMFAKLRKAP